MGTALSTGKGQPALDGVYKLGAYLDGDNEWKHTLKISEQLVKITTPGILDVRRFYSEQEGYIGDMIYDELHSPLDSPVLIDPIDSSKKKKIVGNISYTQLLRPILREGASVYERPNLDQIQLYAMEQIEKFHPSVMRFLYPTPYFVGLEKGLYERKMKLIERFKGERSTISY